MVPRCREVCGGEAACPPPAVGRPPAATSAAACSRSRAVSRQRGGMPGRDPVNDLRGLDGSRQSQRRFTHAAMTRSWPCATPAGRVVTYSLTRPDAIRHWHHAAPGTAVTTQNRPVAARQASAPFTATPAARSPHPYPEARARCGAGPGFVDDGLAAGVDGEERLDGKVVDGPGQAAAGGVDQGDGVVGYLGSRRSNAAFTQVVPSCTRLRRYGQKRHRRAVVAT